MTILQWALLIAGAVAVIAIYLGSRRKAEPPRPAPAAPPAQNRAPAADQMDMFNRGGSEFDEFGVGKPRKRATPLPGAAAEGESRAMFPGVDRETAPPARKERMTPSFVNAPKDAPKAVEEMIVTLLIAEREGTAIFGPKIHKALQDNGLVFGDRRIYHRMSGDRPVFSVASLVKPGTLDPGEQVLLSTPGLSVFMVLPGPVKPVAALKDMVQTSRKLAEALNAQVFDADRQPFDDDAHVALSASVDAWIKRHA